MRLLLVIVLSISVLPAVGCDGCGRSSTGTSASAIPSASASPGEPPKPPALSPADLAAAENAVIAYYAAIAASDCPSLLKLVEPAMTVDDCKEASEEWAKHGGTFDKVVERKTDARDGTVALITVRFASGAGSREQVIRAKNVGGTWKLLN